MSQPQISIIVPTFIETDNISLLVDQINLNCKLADITYEIIFVDDHSPDTTRLEIEALQNHFPIRLFEKSGNPGKSQSLIEGIAQAKAEIIATIDADLQYPASALTQMYRKLKNGYADVLVAERKINSKNHSWLRKISKLYQFLLDKGWHNFDVDVQSGLKVFRKEVFSRLQLTPSKWSFDLEFLVKARHAGYLIKGHKIGTQDRVYGRSKTNLISSLEIFYSYLKIKVLDQKYAAETIALHPYSWVRNINHNNKIYTPYTTLPIKQTAISVITPAQIFSLLLLIFSWISLFFFNWHLALVVTISGLSLLYFVDLIFNLFLVYRSYAKEIEIKVSPRDLKDINRQWPKYTIFCPLYKEDRVLPQFVKAMSQMDYPKDKLEVMLLLEADDKITIEAAEKMNLPKYFRIVVVPDSLPKTKPKACNYGLGLATGEYVVIYDAEDIPDKDQLKKAVIAFENSSKKIGCIQAKLNFYNPKQNLLTKFFTLEYSLWFDLILTGLQSINAPIPLGGTSNHFRRRDLLGMEGWDPFNVTEDADLGMRIIKKGYSTAILNSVTWEEANSQTRNWFKQRSRWIKGYMQTYLVHMRRPLEFLSRLKISDIFTFQLVVGGKIISMIINPILWIITCVYIFNRATVGPFIDSLYVGIFYYMAIFSLVIGNFLYLYYYMMGASKRKQWGLIKYSLLVPAYWLMMSFAATYAFYELIVRPHHWNKTKHGLHLKDIKSKKTSALNRFVQLITTPWRKPELTFQFSKNSIWNKS